MRFVRRLAGSGYRWIMAFAGRRALERMLSRGLPPRLAPALRFLFTGHATPEARRAAARVEELRAKIARQPDTYRFVQHENPLGAVRWLERVTERADDDVTSRHLARSVSVDRRWGMFLHLCADGFEARTILEMGACVGISGAYLASARSHPRLVTIDASEALAAVARETLAAVTDRATMVVEPFATGLPRALASIAAPIDLAYIDGHHDEQATQHYVRTVVPHLAPGAVVVLDDIHLYAEMWRAWQAVASIRGFAAAVNVGRFGLLVWSGGDVTPVQYDLARFTGWWPVGRSRKRSLER
ncbi:MAG TPA: class I SAM-dependent methyltransferase [Thermoanaerobaculia bacterium]|jgi:predicted O-methyltransferase YrrM